jgi:hypothetical protein
MTTTFSRVATVTAGTKRAAVVSGKRGQPSTYLTGLLCLPLTPVDSEIRQRLQLNTPHEVLQTFIDGAVDVAEGDILVIGSAEYPIKAVGNWSWRNSSYLHLVVEELKR